MQLTADQMKQEWMRNAAEHQAAAIERERLAAEGADETHEDPAPSL